MVKAYLATVDSGCSQGMVRQVVMCKILLTYGNFRPDGSEVSHVTVLKICQDCLGLGLLACDQVAPVRNCRAFFNSLDIAKVET